MGRPRTAHCLPRANHRKGTEPPTPRRASRPGRAGAAALGLGVSLYTPQAGPSRLPPQGKPDLSGHTPTTWHLRLLPPLSETTLHGRRECKRRDPAHVPVLPTACHRPRPLKFLVRHPPMWLHTGVNSASSEKCLYSEARTRAPNHSPPPLPLPLHRTALWPRPSQERGATVEPEVYTQTCEDMTGARSSLRRLRGHHGSFPPRP